MLPCVTGCTDQLTDQLHETGTRGRVDAPGVLFVPEALRDVEDTKPRYGQAVLLRAGRIAAIARQEELQSQASRTVSLPKMLMVPGLVNAHTHGFHSPEERRRAFLTQGVTLIGNVGAPLEALPSLLRACTDGGLPSTTVSCSGPMLTAPGGYPGVLHGPGWGYEVTGKQAARAGVRRLYAQGARLLKIAHDPGPRGNWPMLSMEVTRVAVNEAHALGMTVRCHADDVSGYAFALEAGADVVEHVAVRRGREYPFAGPAGTRRPDAAYTRDLIRLARAGTLLCPTLEPLWSAMTDHSGPMAVLRVFLEAGGRVVVGTDCPFRGALPGAPLREMELLRKTGMSQTDVMGAATQGACLALGQTDRGLLREGMRGDFLAVRGDPFLHQQALRDSLTVFVAGEKAFV